MGLFNQILFSQKPDITSSLSGLWKFDEGSGTTTADSSSNGFPMTLSTPPPIWLTPGQVGTHALLFTGSAFAQTAADSAINFGGSHALTVAAWFKTSASSSTNMSGICVTQNGQGDGTYDKGWGVHNSGRAGFYYFQSPSAIVITGSTVISDGNWHHVCAVFTGTQVLMYVDGRLEAYRPATSTFQFTTPRLVVSLVTGGTGSAIGVWSAFSGSIDDVRFYGRALSNVDVYGLSKVR